MLRSQENVICRREIEEKHANDTDLYPDTQDAPTDNSMTIPLEEPNQKQSKTKDTSKDKNVIELPKEEEKPTLGGHEYL